MMLGKCSVVIGNVFKNMLVLKKRDRPGVLGIEQQGAKVKKQAGQFGVCCNNSGKR